MSELPPPAPPTPSMRTADVAPAPTSAPARTFTTPWRIMMLATWGAVILAFAAVWKTSEELGIGTWWLGTRSNPSMALVRLVPFAVAAVPMIAISSGKRWAWWASLGASIALIGVSIPDFSRSAGIALVELVIGAAALLVTAASWTGRAPGPGAPVDLAAGSPLDR